jgi:hypothetical protein
MTRTTLPTLAAALALFTCVARAEGPAPVAAPMNRTGTAIPGLLADADSRGPIQVEKIVVVQETPWSLILDVTYVYEAAPPPEQVKLRVMPDMPYWTIVDAKVAKGRNVARVEIGLYEKKLKDDGRGSYETSSLTVSFQHYAPSGFKGAIHDEHVPFMKLWRPRG